MNPPRYLIDQLRALGRTGELTSIVCLGAALLVKRGQQDTRLLSIQDPVTGESLSEDAQAFIRKLHDEAVSRFREMDQGALDFAIALYRAHLKEAGYTTEDGYAH